MDQPGDSPTPKLSGDERSEEKRHDVSKVTIPLSSVLIQLGRIMQADPELRDIQVTLPASTSCKEVLDKAASTLHNVEKPITLEPPFSKKTTEIFRQMALDEVANSKDRSDPGLPIRVDYTPDPTFSPPPLSERSRKVFRDMAREMVQQGWREPY